MSFTHFFEQYQRNYLIDVEQQPLTPVTVRLYFTDAEYNQLASASVTNVNNQDDVSSISDIKVTKYHKVDGTMDNNYGNNDFNCPACFTVLTPSSYGNDFGSMYIDVQINSFSEFWPHGGSSGSSWLPVELLSFEAKCWGNNVLIRWLTASEQNNNYFTIERSSDGLNFTEIAKVNGSGNSNSIIEYSILDQNKPEGQVYYRLTQTDFDGVKKIFDPEILNCSSQKGNNEISILPNPFKDFINITGNIKGLCLIEIFNSLGERVYNNSLTIEGTEKINLDFLKPGIYLIKVTDSSGKIKSSKMVKN